jgi:hypothetical protein
MRHEHQTQGLVTPKLAPISLVFTNSNFISLQMLNNWSCKYSTAFFLMDYFSMHVHLGT